MIIPSKEDLKVASAQALADAKVYTDEAGKNAINLVKTQTGEITVSSLQDSAGNDISEDVKDALDLAGVTTEYISNHIGDKNNPHSVTPSQIGAVSLAAGSGEFYLGVEGGKLYIMAKED